MYLVWLFVTLSCIYSNAKVVVPTLKLNDGREIPAIALGTWLGNNTKGRVEPESDEVERAVAWAIDAGYRHIDTAYIYRVEDQVGRAVGKKIAEGMKREELFITTKLWNEHHARDAVVPVLTQQLQALGLDYVDLYLIHWPVGIYANRSFDLTDYLDTWRGMMEAKRQGLTKSIGLSNFNEAMIDRILEHGLEIPAALQVELNLNLQQPSLLAYCRSKQIVVMAYTPFGSLFPSKAKPGAPPPRVDDPALVDIAARHNKTVPQIVLRYLVELGVIPLPKSLTRARIEENVDIFDFELSADEKQTLKTYDTNYRTLPQLKWIEHPYYPFEKQSAPAELFL